MVTRKPSVSLSLGSNLGDRAENLAFAVREVANYSKIRNMSHIYETVPWKGAAGDSDYYNAAIEVITELKPLELLDRLNEIEVAAGRDMNAERYSARTLDIDIIFYGDKILNNEKLTIPHPKIKVRGFVLAPLAEIMPFHKFAGPNESIGDLYTAWAAANSEHLPKKISPLSDYLEKEYV